MKGPDGPDRPRRSRKAPTLDPSVPVTAAASSTPSLPSVLANKPVLPEAQAIADQYLAELPDAFLGRYSKLSHADAISMLLRGVSLGLSDTDSCQAAGIDFSTYSRWLTRASEEPTSAYATFASALKERRAAGKVERLQRIADAGLKDQHWTANAWLLERTDPAQFALKTADQAGGPKVIVNIGVIGNSDVKVSIDAAPVSPLP